MNGVYKKEERLGIVTIMDRDKLYQFKEDNSCNILASKPPRHWYNYLWSNKGYCAQVSQVGNGKSQYINEKSDMCRVNHQDTRYVYLRDDISGSCWNIGEGPMNVPVDDFSCEHSLASSTIQSQNNNILASWRLYVPFDGFHEVWTLRLKNNSIKPRNISIFSVVSFELEGFQYPRYYEMYRSCETSFDQELNGIYCSSKHPFTPHNRYNAYIASSEPVAAYDGDLSVFLGTLGTSTNADASISGIYQSPDTVVKGLDCKNSETALFTLGGVLQNKITLKPDEEKVIHIVFGVFESLQEARDISTKFSEDKEVESCLLDTIEYYNKRYSTLEMVTPNEKINQIMNQWLKKQVDFCIVGKKGVRDNLQIAVALLMYQPEKAKSEILECLRHQFQHGHAVLTWYPYDDTRYSDQPFWIIWAVCELLKETGDFKVLDIELEYQDGGKGTVLEHVKAAVNRLIEDKGPNGLIKIWFADWNDALNVTTDPEAESVMLSAQSCLAFQELALLMDRIGDTQYASFLKKEYQTLKQCINDKAWDGKWYVRAISKSEIIGSTESKGSKIYLNPQIWAVLAGVVDDDRMLQVIESIDSMEHDFGFPLNIPAYNEYSADVGRMSGMLPGLFENGGVYCHATGFKIYMDCLLGRADEAINTLLKIMPDSSLNPSYISGAEPYVFTNCYAIHPKYYGKSYQSWTTGTSAWAMISLYEGILGIKRSYDGLVIQPCLPSEWDKVQVYKEFRGSKYKIIVENQGGESSKVAKITVDNVLWNSNVLPLFNDNVVHEVYVILNEK